jgi:outer membrane lipoprotein carrier protein
MNILRLVQTVVLAVSAVPQSPAPPAQEIAAAVQKKYDATRDFTADFVHESEGGLLRRKQVERGFVQVKKPGKMRWDYKSPETKVFVSDGRRIYLHVPADNQVIVSPVPAEDQATTAVLFLVGKGSLTRDFTATYADPAPPDTYALRLQPRIPETDYDWLQIVIDRKTLQIRSLTAVDREGGRSAFQFTNFKENVGLADKTFAFKIPKGADVTTNGSSAR